MRRCFRAKLKLAEKTGCLPKIVVPVHFSGQSCNMVKIRELSRIYGFSIIEDASHAIGGSYKDEKIGCGRYSDITIFSFHPVKIITTGEGGMLMTNSDDLQDKLSRLRTHGITRNAAQMTGDAHGPWYYQQINLGFNYRITDIQAALGLSQLSKIDEFISARRKLVASYAQKLSGLPLTVPYQNSDCAPSWHLYVVLLNLNKLKKSRLEIFEEINKLISA